MAQNVNVVQDLADEEAAIQVQWAQFQNVLKTHSDQIPPDLADEDLFYACYAIVCSRCFGSGVDSCCLIPMADNLNHSSVDITQELINTNLQLLDPVDQSYIVKAKFNNNYSDLFHQLGYSLDEISQNDFKIKGRHDFQAFL